MVRKSRKFELPSSTTRRVIAENLSYLAQLLAELSQKIDWEL